MVNSYSIKEVRTCNRVKTVWSIDDIGKIGPRDICENKINRLHSYTIYKNSQNGLKA